MTRTPLRPLARILDARAKGENPKANGATLSIQSSPTTMPRCAMFSVVLAAIYQINQTTNKTVST